MLIRTWSLCGHAGSGRGQLEAELAADAWILKGARVEDVLTDAPDLLWSHLLRRKAPRCAALARIPLDPSMN